MNDRNALSTQLSLCGTIPPKGGGPLVNEKLHVVTDPEEEKVVMPYLTPGGQTLTGDKLKEEVARRLRDRGLGGSGFYR